LSRWSLNLPCSLCPHSSSKAVALCIYMTVQLGWILARLERKTDFGKTLGLCAMINLQVLLIPVSRKSLFLVALFMAPENAVRFHRLLGWATLWMALAHFLWYAVQWSWEGVFLHKVFSWEGKVPIFPGFLALLVSTPLFVTSIPLVRRRYSYELFIHIHRMCSFMFAVCLSLHFPGILWWCLPSLLLYLSDHASQLHVWRNLMPVKRACCQGGVISVTLPCSAKFTRPAPLQWVALQAPGLSLLQWHPFTVASSTDDEFTIAMRVFPHGWTGALGVHLLTVRNVALRVGGPYGLGCTFENYDRGQPLFMIAGGSGGTPFTSLVQAISERQCRMKSSRLPPVLLAWVFRTEEMMAEYVCQTGLLKFACRCHKITVKLFVTRPQQESVRPIETSLEQVDIAQSFNDPKHQSSQSHSQTLIVVLCHVFVCIGALMGIQHGLETRVSGGYQFAYLLIGAFLGAMLANIVAVLPRAVALEGQFHRRLLPTKGFTSARSIQMSLASGIGAKSEEDAMSPLALVRCGGADNTTSSLDVTPHAKNAGVEQGDALGVCGTDARFVSYHAGRPDIAALLQDFEMQCASNVKSTTECCLQRMLAMASGPPDLVSAVSSAALARGHEFESLSFDL